MAEEINENVEEVVDDQTTEDTEEHASEQPEAQASEHASDKPVEQSTFNKYREAYLRQQLSEMKVNNDEMESALKFVDGEADTTDSNLDEVFRKLQLRMRLNERQRYADPSPMNGAKDRPKRIGRNELQDYGKQIYKRARNKTRGNL